MERLVLPSGVLQTIKPLRCVRFCVCVCMFRSPPPSANNASNILLSSWLLIGDHVPSYRMLRISQSRCKGYCSYFSWGEEHWCQRNGESLGQSPALKDQELQALKKSSIWPEVRCQFWRAIKLGNYDTMSLIHPSFGASKGNKIEVAGDSHHSAGQPLQGCPTLAIVYSAKVLGNWINGPSPYLTIVMFRI